MGIFDSFSKGFNQGMKRARDEAYRREKPNNLPVKLVEPSIGRTVELQVTEQNNKVAKLYMDQLTTYAKGLEQLGVQWKVTDKTIRLIFTDNDMAENTRKHWRR